MRKKKIIIFGLLFFTVVAFAAMHHSLVCLGVKSYLSSHSPKGTRLAFEYDTMHYDKGQIVLREALLKSEGIHDDLGFEVRVDDLKVAVDFSLFPFYFKPKLLLDHPQLKISSGPVEGSQKQSDLFHLLDKYLFKASIEVHKGELSFGNQVAFLDFETPEEDKPGRLQASQREDAPPSFLATFSKDSQEMRFELTFDALDTTWAFELGRYFFPQIGEEIKIEQGSIGGTLSLGLTAPQKIDYIKYNLNLDDLLFSHKKYGLDFGVHHLNWKEHFTSNIEMGSLKSHPFFDKVWPYFIGEGELSGLSIKVSDSKQEREWSAFDVRGTLRFSRQSEPLAHLYGTFKHQRKEYPFQLTGEGFIENDNFWKIAFDANMLSDKKMQTYVSLASQGEKRYLLQTEFSDVNTDLLTLFHHLISAHIPQPQNIQIQGGTFAGKIQGTIDNKQLTRCEVTSFAAEDVEATLGETFLSWKAQEMHGQGEFDLSTADFFDGTFWELNVAEGRLETEKNGVLDHLDCHIAMHDQYVKPSMIKCRFRDIVGQVTFEGLYSHLNLNADFSITPDELSKFLGVEKSDELDASIAMNLDLHLKTLKKQMTVEGALSFLHQKHKKDSLLFGWNCNLPKLMAGDINEAIDLGWFKAVNLSQQTLNLPLSLLHLNWRMKGEVNVEGTFNSSAVEFSVDPSRVIYTSPTVDIKPNLVRKEKAPNCVFNLDLKNKEWRGKLPLKEIYLKEHAFGIEFESFTSEVDLEGSTFLFQNVDAYADGVHFQAEMTLNFDEEGQSELSINTHQIDAKAEDVLQFLRHFKPFSNVDFPIQGVINSGPGDMHLKAAFGQVEELIEWNIALHFQGGSYPFSEALAFENLAGDFYYSAEDQSFKIKKTEGQLLLKAGEQQKSYALNVPLLDLDFLHNRGEYDVRLETPTYDICRLAGTALKDGELKLFLDPDRTRLFGARVNASTLSLKEDGAFSEVNVETTLSSLDLFHHLDFLVCAGLLPLKHMTLNEMRTPNFDGAVDVSFSFDQKEERLVFAAKSDHLICGPLDLDHLAVHVERRGDHIILDQFEAGSLSIKASMDKFRDTWSMPRLEMAWKECYLQGMEGHFSEQTEQLKLPIQGLKVNLEELTALFAHSDLDWSYLIGTLFATGELVVDFSGGLRNLSCNASVKVIGEDFGKGKLRLETPESLYFSYEAGEGFKIEQANFNFLHPRSNQHWAKCHFDSLSYYKKEWMGKNFILIVPPEMMHFLGQTRSLPSFDYEEERLVLFGHSLRWDNQMEVTMDFAIGENSQASGYLKEGYYWIGDKAWYLNDFAFAYKNGAFDLNLNTLFDEMPFDLRAHFSFLPHFTSKVVIQETFREERASGNPLVLKTGWNEQEGFYLRSIDGEVCGLNFDFHHNPKESFLDRSVLTGQLKMNIPAFARILPKTLRSTVKEFEVGKGYELSGDLIVSKLNLKDSYFSGYLKGKNFQLMGSVMKTMLSEITIYPNQVELANFNISDTSGIFSIKAATFEQNEEQRWSLVVPDLEIQDFRPSLLKKVDKYPGRIKPLTIRNLHFRNMRGFLGDAYSFTGKGELNFINTFKRDYNILDLPFEILGRLGLDMGLLIPVRGQLNFVMVDGRIYLTNLTKSYSEGKRSQFYLSPTVPSFVDFDGNIDINIKMKQYVLLKVTEPFTLSIGGTFENPKYGLK